MPERAAIRPTADRLTRSQRDALLVALDRDPTPVYTSNRNGKTYIATGSYDVLNRLGLMMTAGDPLSPHLYRRVVLTPKGRALAHGIAHDVTSPSDISGGEAPKSRTIGPVSDGAAT